MADLNKYWALKEIKERCAPISIYECVLHTAFYEKDPWSLRPTDYGGWTEGKWERVELPEEFWLISPDRKYKFDLREYYDGFAVSERFLSLLLSMEVQPFVYKEVFIVNKRKQSIIESKYYYIQFYLKTDVSALEKMSLGKPLSYHLVLYQPLCLFLRNFVKGARE